MAFWYKIGVGRDNPKIKSLEKVFNWAVVPFFFVSIGIHFDFNSLFINPVVLIIILAVAMAGKLVGAFLIKPLTSFTWKQLFLIGWGMNSRGVIGLALALVAFRSGIIQIELYSSLIIMALVTSLIFPFIIIKMVKEEPGLME